MAFHNGYWLMCVRVATCASTRTTRSHLVMNYSTTAIIPLTRNICTPSDTEKARQIANTNLPELIFPPQCSYNDRKICQGSRVGGKYVSGRARFDMLNAEVRRFNT